MVKFLLQFQFLIRRVSVGLLGPKPKRSLVHISAFNPSASQGGVTGQVGPLGFNIVGGFLLLCSFPLIRVPCGGLTPCWEYTPQGFMKDAFGSPQVK